MMPGPSLLIFAGPTLSGVRLPPDSRAQLLPPAAHGDVYRATLVPFRPRALLLVDGYFGAQPAVRHKEILWALSQRIYVFGASSIGALRAAELAPFGMLGVGAVFEAFRSGILEDDDEVAVEHGPAELGYAPVSEAMVDIRATLAAALRNGVVSTSSHARLVAVAKKLFYPRRSYATMLARGGEDGVPMSEIEALRRWLTRNRVSQKREDALAALALVGDFLDTNPPPFRPLFRFERTEVWEADIVRSAEIASLRREQEP
jgi:hypothetical protein